MSRPPDAWSPQRRRDRCTGLSDATPVVIARPHLSANDTTESKWDSHDLVDLVDALADYTAHLLSQGQLDDLCPIQTGRVRPIEKSPLQVPGCHPSNS